MDGITRSHLDDSLNVRLLCIDLPELSCVKKKRYCGLNMRCMPLVIGVKSHKTMRMFCFLSSENRIIILYDTVQQGQLTEVKENFYR